MNAYKIDFAAGTITITAACAKAMNDPESAEYKAIAQIGASKAMALNVTYTAWAILFTVVILRDTSVLTLTTILCSLVVLLCGIFAAADFKDIFGKKNG